ncbi:MAG: hypothetical protein AB1521_01220 [Bacteroidota bacterium]
MKRLIILILFLAATLSAQNENNKLTGSLFIDSKISFDNSIIKLDSAKTEMMPGKKSPLLAAGLSLLIPGAGEFYSESYIKSAIFIAAEVAAVAVGLIYDNKGDDQTVSFQNYANTHWDLAKYARWTIDNLESHLNQEIGNDLKASDYANLFYDAERSKVNLTVLNKLENDIGGWYSHRIPQKGDQQYYEMIGKYPQFNVGWDDYVDGDRPFVYGDPLTENFKYYSNERGKANDFYNVAKTAVIVIVVNHVLSAADAAWTASSYNKNLSISADVKKIDLGYRTYYYPQLNLQYRF